MQKNYNNMQHNCINIVMLHVDINKSQINLFMLHVHMIELACMPPNVCMRVVSTLSLKSKYWTVIDGGVSGHVYYIVLLSDRKITKLNKYTSMSYPTETWLIHV